MDINDLNRRLEEVIIGKRRLKSAPIMFNVEDITYKDYYKLVKSSQDGDTIIIRVLYDGKSGYITNDTHGFILSKLPKAEADSFDEDKHRYEMFIILRGNKIRKFSFYLKRDRTSSPEALNNMIDLDFIKEVASGKYDDDPMYKDVRY